MDVFKAIELIKDAGGVPVLAHQQKINFYTENELLKFIKKAKKHGLMGIEVYYAEFNEEEINYNKNLATHFDLLESVGSDFHIIDDENKLPGLGINNNLCKTDCSLLDYLLEKKLVVSK